MIDWLKFRIPWNAPNFDTTRIIVVEPDGTISWEKQKPLEVRGSWETSLHVSACPVDGRLLIDGNPTKFFQGHNLWGGDNPHPIVRHTLAYLVDVLKLEIPAETLDDVNHGQWELSRIDLANMYSFGNLSRCRDALRTIEQCGRMKRRVGGFVMSKGTAYSNKNSRRQSTKAYCKGDEITAPKHKLAGGLDQREKLIDYANQSLRIEHVIRGMWLKDRLLHLGVNWHPSTAANLYAELINKLELPEMIELTGDTLEGLSPRIQLAYDSWRGGKDLRALLPKATFYRYRADLLEHGIDIAIKQPSEPSSNVVPLRVTLVGTPMGIPEWAHDTNAVWRPSKRA